MEYSAASDSFTACPEGFNEFYNQRRRWMPSTIANIMDLLADYKRVIRNNDDISYFYIAYQVRELQPWRPNPNSKVMFQVMMMVGTVLGPGSIFLMLVGACAVAFSISNWLSFILNLIPLLIFIVVCLTCKSNYQLLLAQVRQSVIVQQSFDIIDVVVGMFQILSVAYALVMMAVLVGLLIQIAEDGYDRS